MTLDAVMSNEVLNRPCVTVALFKGLNKYLLTERVLANHSTVRWTRRSCLGKKKPT